MPRITPKRYLVEYRCTPDEEAPTGGTKTYEVRVVPADMLRAEENGPRYGITNPQTQAIAMTMMWLWAASVREGHTPGVSWPDFRENIVDYGKAGEDEPLDPTRPTGPTPSPSDSGPQASGDLTSGTGSSSSETTPAS